MIIALAGRRIDEENADYDRFPLKNAILVKKRLETYIKTHNVKYIVCSAACGADLIALDIANRFGLYKKVILPTTPQTFKAYSVTDRPGNWGKLFDKIVTERPKKNEIIIMNLPLNNEQSYLATNEEIINQAEIIKKMLGHGEQLRALVVWEGNPRSQNDITLNFFEQANKRGIHVDEILTH